MIARPSPWDSPAVREAYHVASDLFCDPKAFLAAAIITSKGPLSGPSKASKEAAPWIDQHWQAADGSSRLLFGPLEARAS